MNKIIKLNFEKYFGGVLHACYVLVQMYTVLYIIWMLSYIHVENAIFFTDFFHIQVQFLWTK